MKSLYNISLVLLVLAGVCGLSSTSVAQQNNEQKIIFGNQDKTITVYPVPASTVAYIRLSPSLKNEVDKVELVNLIGRKIADQPVIDKNAEIVFNNLNEQPAGIYMIIARDKFGKILQSTKLVLGK
jgi:hypothetical protein